MVCHGLSKSVIFIAKNLRLYHEDSQYIFSTKNHRLFQLSTKVRKGRGSLPDRDVKLCRRLLLEMYNLWPESVPFRDLADLKFEQYLQKIKVGAISTKHSSSELRVIRPNAHQGVSYFVHLTMHT